MDISHYGKIEKERGVSIETNASVIFSNRRALWMAGFAFCSMALFLVSPTIGFSLALVLALSISNVVVVNRWKDHYLANSDYYTFSGSVLAAALLWVSILAGNSLAGMVDLGGFTSVVFVESAFSLVLFAVLIVAENVLVAVVQFFVARKQDPAIYVACMLDMKCAGLLGETR